MSRSHPSPDPHRRPAPVLRSLAAASALLVSTAVAASASATLPADRQQALDRFIGQFVDFAMFDGTVLVDVAGEVVYEKSFGYAHYELGVRHAPDTRFRVASVSKTLTDAAVALLVQRGELSLDAPLSRYLPDFPAAGKIRLGQLFDHTSGIPHTNNQSWGDGKTSLTIREIVDRLAALPLDFEPGTRSRYSNGGYAVAARVLEIAGGGPFSEVMRKTLFDPLGMADTDHIADARAPIPGMATGYEPGRAPGERRHSRFYAVETRPGGGSFYSTARDLLRFTRAVFRRGLISPELRRTVLGADDGSFLSQGRSPGFVAKLYYDAENDVIVVSLANSYAVPADWAVALAGLATGRTERTAWPTLERDRRPIRPDDPRLGRYRSSYGAEPEIQLTGGGAMVLVDRRSDSETALVPLADGAFLQPLYFQRCEQEAETRVVTCRMLSGNEQYTGTMTPVGG